MKRRQLSNGYINLVGFIALVLRVAHLGTFATHDEVEFWFYRANTLLRGISMGNLSEIAISTHPGVTTMWLGGAGIMLHNWLFEQGILSPEQGTFATMLMLYRLPTALVHVALILYGYTLMRRTLAPGTALLAAVLWACDPFTVAYSRLLHVDALAGSFAMVSLLSLVIYAHAQTARAKHALWWLMGAAVWAGLAIVTKSPALALVPVTSSVVVVVVVAARDRNTQHPFAMTTVFQLVKHVVLWCVVCGFTIVAVWPSLWVAPSAVFEALRVGVAVEGAQPHMTGNFFLGHRMENPGWQFYPVVLALRATPWTLIGVLAVPFAIRYIYRHHHHERIPIYYVLIVMIGWVVLLTIGLSLFPKKFNRYLVMAFPMYNTVAAVGLTGLFAILARLFSKKTPNPSQHTTRRKKAVVASVVAVVFANALYYHPYNIVYFNQLLGGTQAGVQNVAVGWGEGLDQVAAWLNQQPDICDVLTISHMITSYDPFLVKGARATFPKEGTLKTGTGYVVTYIYQVQGGLPTPPFDDFYRKRVPLHVVKVHGVAYAWIYRAPPPVARQINARFGDDIVLYGDTPAKTTNSEPHTLRYQLVWETRHIPPRNYWLFAYLLNNAGERVAQIDQPYATTTWQPGHFAKTELQLTLPSTIDSGTYTLIIGLYDSETWQRLPIQNITPSSVPHTIEPHALVLEQVVR